MDTIGIIGGMSWASTITYYRVINEQIIQDTQQKHCAKCIIFSVDSSETEALLHRKDWTRINDIIMDAGAKVRKAGADFILVASNSIHIALGDKETLSGLPLLHIETAIARHVKNRKMEKIGFIGTSATMEGPVYKELIDGNKDVNVVLPNIGVWQRIDEIIFTELCRGKITRSARNTIDEIILSMEAQGVEAVVMACTELGMLYEENANMNVPLVDSAVVHSVEAAQYAIRDKSI